MNAVVKWGVILAVVVAVITALFAVTGMHKNPITGLVFVVVAIVLNIVAVFMALKQTASESSYGKQLLNAGMVGVIAGVLILLSSWLMLSVVFPDYIEESKEGTIAFFESMNLTDEQFDEQLAKLDEVTPRGQAIQGFIGTFFTSLIAGAIVAIFQRRK